MPESSTYQSSNYPVAPAGRAPHRDRLGSQTRPSDDERDPGVLRLRAPDGREVRVERRVVVGSGRACDLVVDDPYASDRHCLVMRDEGRTIVRDSSKNGVWLGGARLHGGAGELRPGLTLTVGKTPLLVLADDEADDEMIGSSEALGELRRWIARVAPTRWPVLLLGESGTGKELAARAVHTRSARPGRFVPVNCGALSPELVESELFGHERGAFTGAAGRRSGVFEEAEGGTLFLDEIAELPLTLQPKLLRALETGTVRAVGSSVERRVHVRIVAATHQDLRRLCDHGRFRLDLYQRLSAIEVRLPALRERPTDIPYLARHFLDEIETESGPRELTPAALAALGSRRWSGNIRELKNALRYATLVSDRFIDPEHLPAVHPTDVTSGHPVDHASHLAGGLRDALVGRHGAPDSAAHEGGHNAWPVHSEHVHGASRPAAARPPGPSPTQPMRDLEREAIALALEHHGTGRRAAEALGMPKSTLHDKARRYGLRVPRSEGGGQ